jgi:hypothetical protein
MHSSAASQEGIDPFGVAGAHLIALIAWTWLRVAHFKTGSETTSVDALLQAFPAGMTPAQLDAVLGVIPDDAVRAALRDHILSEYAARREAAKDTSPRRAGRMMPP